MRIKLENESYKEKVDNFLEFTTQNKLRIENLQDFQAMIKVKVLDVMPEVTDFKVNTEKRSFYEWFAY